MRTYRINMIPGKVGAVINMCRRLFMMIGELSASRRI